MAVLAVDLGGTRAKVGLVHGGRVLAHRLLAMAPGRGLRAQLPRLAEAAAEVCREKDWQPGALEGVAFGFPGLVDAGANRILATNAKYDDAQGVDLPAWAQECWGLPLRLENDARLALLGEWTQGAGRGCDDLVMLTLGTGVGTAVLSQGRLLTGKHHQAGSLGGHFVVEVDGPLCGCGNRGCVEAVASTWALEAQAGPGLEGQGYEGLFKRADAGDAQALALKEKSLHTWAAAIITLIHAYDPERVVISGGVMQRAAELLPWLQERVARRAWTPWGQVTLVAAQYPDLAALLGGATLFQAPAGQELRL